MPDIGMMELLVVGIVALIVVGPKDLPKMFRTFGQVTGRVRGMAKDFTRAMDDAAGDSGLKDISKDMRNLTNPKKMGLDAVSKAFDDIDPTKFDEGSETRNLAEKRAADNKAARETADAKRKAREDEIRNAKLAAMPETDTPPAVSPPSSTPVDSAEIADDAATPRTGTDQA